MWLLVLRSGGTVNGAGNDPLVLHGCEVDTYDGPGEPRRCGAPASLWDSPSGRRWFLCAEHRAAWSGLPLVGAAYPEGDDG